MGKSLKWMAMASQEPNECLFFTVVIQCGKLIYKQYRNIKSERNIKCRERERERERERDYVVRQHARDKALGRLHFY